MLGDFSTRQAANVLNALAWRRHYDAALFTALSDRVAAQAAECTTEDIKRVRQALFDVNHSTSSDWASKEMVKTAVLSKTECMKALSEQSKYLRI